jgi:hypothetical protein
MLELEMAVGFPALITPAVCVDTEAELLRDEKTKLATAIPATKATKTIFK